MSCTATEELPASDEDGSVVLFHNGMSDVDDDEENSSQEEPAPIPTEDIAVILDAPPVQPPPSPRSKLPSATQIRTSSFLNTINPGVPLAVTILSSHDSITRLSDMSKVLPPMFANYDGPGGERARTFLHSIMAEVRATASYKYPTHANVKFALFVGFVDLCCAFTPAPTEEICDIVVSTTTAFMDNIRALCARDVYTPLKEYGRASAHSAISDQVAVARAVFAEKYDARVLLNDDRVPLEWIVADSPLFGNRVANMFEILHTYAENRDTVFYAYAQYVRAELAGAFNRRYIYVSHIFLRYFIFAVTAVSRLIPCNWNHAIKNTVDGDQVFAAEALKNKIVTVLHTNFVDLSTYMGSEAHGFEAQFVTDFRRYSGYKSTLELQSPAASSVIEPNVDQPTKSFRPKISMPVEDAAQQSSGCLML